MLIFLVCSCTLITDADVDAKFADSLAAGATDSTGDTEAGGDTGVVIDADGDGYPAGEDCDDHNGAINPAATDVVGDAVDQNCDEVDGADADGDGHAADWSGGDDCDDAEANAYAGASERCGDEVDNDCDGSLACLGSLTDAEAVYTGQPGDRAGSALAGAGDVNDDGFADILVGADDGTEGGGARMGAVYLVLGGASPSSESLAGSDAAYYGEADNDSAGQAVAGAGDVDLDGYADMVFGVAYNDAGGDAAGAVYVQLGSLSPTSGSLADADAIYTGEAAGDYAGYAVASVGDMDDDGYADFVVGAPGGDGYAAGAAYLVLGSQTPRSGSLAGADAVYTGASAGDWVGGSLGGAGDTNGDGHDDLLIGQGCNGSGYRTSPSSAYLILGADSVTSGSLAAADAQYQGAPEEITDGLTVAGAGDVDGDGYTDILIGQGLNDGGGYSAGVAHLVLGRPLPVSDFLSASAATFLGAEGEYAGCSLAGAGDLNGDSYDDIVIGAMGNGEAGELAGAAYVVFGSPSPNSEALVDSGGKFWGAAERDYAGRAVAGAGDVDRDGRADVLVAAPYNDDGGTDAGAAYLLTGDGF